MFYQYDPRIHQFGNVGLLGAVHAEFAPIFNKIIDIKAYSGRNIRNEIIKKLSYDDENNKINENNILDLCCGVGISTSKFGIDTSPQMINKAIRHFSTKNFAVENAETVSMNSLQNKFGDRINFNKFDIITCMFSFHEMPIYAHEKIIENSLELIKKEMYIIDLNPEYQPREIMLKGEPYLLEYKKSIEKTMDKYNFKRSDYIPNHVSIWKYTI